MTVHLLYDPSPVQVPRVLQALSVHFLMTKTALTPTSGRELEDYVLVIGTRLL